MSSLVVIIITVNISEHRSSHDCVISAACSELCGQEVWQNHSNIIGQLTGGSMQLHCGCLHRLCIHAAQTGNLIPSWESELNDPNNQRALQDNGRFVRNSYACCVEFAHVERPFGENFHRSAGTGRTFFTTKPHNFYHACK